MKKIIQFISIILLFLSMISITNVAYAYWNETQIVLTYTITLGDWDFHAPYDNSYTYSQGDIVEYHGKLYRARYNVPTGIRPNGFWGRIYWEKI